MGDRGADAEAAFWGDTADDVARERYQTLVNAIDDGIYQLDSEGRFQAVNDVIVEITGYDRSELIGQHASSVLEGDDLERVERELRRQLATGEPCDAVELEVETAGGSRLPVEVRPSVLEEDGEYVGSIGVARDITGRRQRTERLEAARQSYETITNVLDEADVGVFILDDEFDVAWVDETIKEYFGVDSDALIGRDKRTVIDEQIADIFADPESFAETVEATYDDNSYVERFECRVTAGEDREGRWLEHRSQPIETGQYAGGRVELYYDITDRKRSETELQENEARFQTMIDAVEEYAIFRLDREGHVISWNEGARRIKGYDREEILGNHVSTFYIDEDRAADVPTTNLERADETGSAEDEGWRLRQDGTRFWANVTITAVRDDDGTHRGYVKVTRDMTDRRERERQLQRERDLTDRILEASPVGIVVFDGDGDVVRYNDRSSELLDVETAGSIDGSESIADVSFRGTVHDEDGTRLRPSAYPVARTLREGEPTLDQVLRIEQPDGTKQWLVTSAVPIRTGAGADDRTVAIVEDVTPIKRRELELESELETTVDRITDAFYALDDDWTFTYVNDRARELVDVDDQGLLGEDIWETFEWGADSKLRDEYEWAMEHQEPTSFELYYPEPIETWFEIHAYPSETGLSVYFRDITDRKKRDRELQESERRYRTLAEYFPNGIVTLFDHDFEYTLAAGQGFDRIPVGPSDLEGRSVREAWPEETADVLEPALKSALEGTDETIELEYAGREWTLRVAPITDERGNVFAGMTMAQDVTERKERERDLEDAKSQLEAATEAGAVGTWEWHVDSDSFVADRSFAETFGIDPDAARDGVSIDRLLASIHDADRDRVERQIEEAVETRGEYESEYRVWNGDDELRWVVARGHVECGDDETVTFPGALTDITERKRAEIALRESRKQLQTLFDVLPVGVVVANQDGKVTTANNTATEIWGSEFFDSGSVAPYDRQTGVWADSGEPVAPDEWTLAQVLDGVAVTDPNVYEIETSDDRRIVMEHGMPIVDEDGEVTRAVVTMTEITERREYQRRLEQTIDQLEASNERLEHFAYAASHDLQEPLRMVSSYLQLIENRYADHLDDDGQEFLEFAVDGADRMREMIDGLLAYSRVETQGEPLEPTDLEGIVADVLENLQVQIRETNAEITMESLPTVEGDPNQLRQLFQNLLANAIEYSGDEPPQVHVAAERNGSMWTISVADDGIGITESDQERIFEVFQRLHSREEYSGTGIGLALGQRIVERHGGDIWVDSEPGEGSTFYVSLPAVDSDHR